MERSDTDDTPYRALSAGQVEAFRRNGFVVPGTRLEAEEAESLGREYDRLFAEARGSERYRNLAAEGGAAQGREEDAAEEMLQITQLCERSLDFRRLLYHPLILDVVEDLLGPNIQLFHDQALYKPAHHGGPIHWHQDNAYWRCLPADLVSCWLTFDDVDADNGAMHLIPGSHLAPVEHERGDVLLDAGSDGAESAFVAELPAGGIMFHHCQTLHHTRPNRTGRRRRAFAMHYMRPGTRSANAGEMPISFSRPLLRCRI